MNEPNSASSSLIRRVEEAKLRATEAIRTHNISGRENAELMADVALDAALPVLNGSTPSAEADRDASRLTERDKWAYALGYNAGTEAESARGRLSRFCPNDVRLAAIALARYAAGRADADHRALAARVMKWADDGPGAEPPHPTAWGPEARAKIEQYRKDTPDAGVEGVAGKCDHGHDPILCPICAEPLLSTSSMRGPADDVGAEPDSVERIAAEWGRLLAADNRRCPEGDDYTGMLQEADRFVRRLIVASRPSAGADQLRDASNIITDLMVALETHIGKAGCTYCADRIRRADAWLEARSAPSQPTPERQESERERLARQNEDDDGF